MLRSLALADTPGYTPDLSPLANLLQVPLMFLVTLVVAPLIVSITGLPGERTVLFKVALVSLVCVVFAEFSVVLWFQGFTLSGYLASPDGFPEALYTAFVGFLALVPFAVAPRNEVQLEVVERASRNLNRGLASVGAGVVVTILYHGILLGVGSVFDLQIESRFVQAMLAAGIALAPQGFEAQVLIPILTVPAVFFAASYLCWMYLRIRMPRR